MKRLYLLLPLLLLIGCQSEEAKIHGYIEGEFVMVAPTSGGVLETLSVTRGQRVEAGAELFALDLSELTAQRDKANAEVAGFQAELNDLMKGKRPEEIEIIQKQKAQAQAAYVNAQREYNRVLPLSANGTISIARRDDAQTALDSARAHLQELDAQLKEAHLGARMDQIDAAKARLESAKQIVVQMNKKISDAAPTALVPAFVQDIFFEAGEFVNSGQAVVSLLPNDHVKVRFFVSQKKVVELKSGQPITVTCDGCEGVVSAKINYIAAKAEYTPPVIYSVESRDKLVFLVEAKPDSYHEYLRPGLPVSIELE